MNYIEIYEYCELKWEKLVEENNGQYIDAHDEIVLNSASEKFNISPEIADKIHREVGNVMTKLNGEYTKENVVAEIEKLKL